MGSGGSRKVAVLPVAAALLVGYAALPVSVAAAPRTILYACASELYGVENVLHYTGMPSSCAGIGSTPIDFAASYPVHACRKEHGTARRAVSRRGISSRAPAGLMRLMDGPAGCSGAHWDESPVILPATQRLPFCVARKTRELRLVRKLAECRKKEFQARLPKREPGIIAALSNQAPVAVDDGASTDDGIAKPISVLSNDTDADGNILHVGSIDTSSTKGNVRLNGDGTVTYDPNRRFKSLGAGESDTDSFTYRATDGSAASAPATVTVALAGVNDAPVAIDDGGATDEDTAQGIPVLANDSDVDGGTPAVGTLDTSGTKGSVTTASGGGVSYDPNGQFDALAPGQTATDTFRYKANDGIADSALFATVTVRVEGRDDAPVVTSTLGDTAYAEGGPAAVIDGALGVVDADDADLEGATVRLSSGFEPGDELRFDDQAGIDGSYDPDTGVLTLTGTAAVADYRTALQSIEFATADDDPASRKSVEFEVDDGSAHSAGAAKDIAVSGANDAPSVAASAGSATFTTGDQPVPVDPEIGVTDPDSAQLSGATVAITSNFSAADGDELLFTPQSDIDGSYDPAAGTLTLTGMSSVANYQDALRSITYRNTAALPSTDTRTVSFLVTDTSGAASNTGTRDVTVSGPIEPPVGP
jgi:VCBS repeat-containing protein